ncbi:NUDIX hydrolase [uncultured Sulfitobacter sp.]|uniref:NUDIX hydrolase n=1 Tax=uncultured Sulfitobacter sp. TaxID=191468 RepID=UPI002608DC18|nr:NUDIX hydrolase [uncultured Sulfitobacter sp.]
MTKQLPISLYGGAKGSARTQFAALCYRIRKGDVQVLLITSRKRKRWIVPKGWPMEGKTPAASALVEAWEEAGVKGVASDACIGVYSYAKIGLEQGGDATPCLALLYPVRVTSLKNNFPEARERRRMWMSRKKAAKLVQHKELAKLIVGFRPPECGGPA